MPGANRQHLKTCPLQAAERRWLSGWPIVGGDHDQDDPQNNHARLDEGEHVRPLSGMFASHFWMSIRCAITMLEMTATPKTKRTPNGKRTRLTTYTAPSAKVSVGCEQRRVGASKD